MSLNITTSSPSTNAAASTTAAPASTPAASTTPNPAAASTGSGAGATEPAKTTPGAAAAGAGKEGETTPPAYVANLKFKVLDKEHDFAPYLKDAIKDEKTEKEVRELYEKAYGLDIVKPKHTKLKEDFTALQTEHTGLVDGIMELRDLYQRNDLDGFFAKLKIPHEKILQYIVDKINYNELPPEQRNALDARRQAERQAFEAQKSSQSQAQQYQEQLAQAKSQMLDIMLQKADVAAFTKVYSEKTGKSFRDAVIDYAEAVYYTRKDSAGNPVDLTPEQAVKEVMEHYGAFVPASAAATAPAGASTTPAPTVPAKEPPVIPNVGGRQSSPATTSGPRSVADLRALYKQKFAQ